MVPETSRPIEVRACGELDIATAPSVERALERAASAQGLVVLDLRDLDFIDATGIRLCLRWHGRLQERLTIRANGPALRMFQLAGLQRTLPLDDC